MIPDLRDRPDDVLHVVPAAQQHALREPDRLRTARPFRYRQIHSIVIDGRQRRTPVDAVVPVPEYRLFVQRDGVARAGGDALGAQGLDETGFRDPTEGVFAVLEHVDVPRVPVALRGPGHRDDAADRTEALGQVLAVRVTPVGLGLQVRHLGQEQGALYLGHPVVAGHAEVVVPGSRRDVPAVGERPRRRRQAVVVGEHDAPLAGIEVLGGLEAEGADRADGADAPAAPARAVGLGRVLDHRQAVAAGDLAQAVHVRGQPREMHRHHGPGPRRDRLLDQAGVQVVGQGIDVDEHGHGVRHHDRAGRRDEGIGRHDDFVAGFDADRLQREAERRGAVADGDAVGGLLEGGEAPLEVAHPLALDTSPMAGTHGLAGRPGAFVQVHGPGREGFGPDRRRAVYGQLGHGTLQGVSRRGLPRRRARRSPADPRCFRPRR